MVKITIELNDADIEKIVNEIEEDECDCECSECNSYCEEGYTTEQMIDANIDELRWYINFANKYHDVLRHHPAMFDELIQRISLGQKVVKNLMEMK
jgi:uncharacterized protein YpbB